jgi:hypothetical protein
MNKFRNIILNFILILILIKVIKFNKIFHDINIEIFDELKFQTEQIIVY